MFPKNLMRCCFLLVVFSCLTFGEEDICVPYTSNCSACVDQEGCGFCQVDVLNNCTTGCGTCVPGSRDGPSSFEDCEIDNFYFSQCAEPVTPQTAMIEVELFLQNFGRVVLTDGTFEADVLLKFHGRYKGKNYHVRKCDPDSDFPECFDFTNSGRNIAIVDHGDFFRVKAWFYFGASVDMFPFDNQTLIIELYDREASATELVFVPHADTGIAQVIDRLARGWGFSSFESFNQEVVQRSVAFDGELHSVYRFEIFLERPFWSAVLKTFLPPFFIVLVVCFSYSLPLDSLSTRASVNGSMLVASVMFHISVSAQTPPTQSLTFADVLLLNVYGFELLSFVITILLIRLKRMGNGIDENGDQTPTASLGEYVCKWLYHWSEIVVWVVVPLYFLMAFIIQLDWWIVITTQILVALGTAIFLAWTKSKKHRNLMFRKRKNTDDDEMDSAKPLMKEAVPLEEISQEESKTLHM